MVKMALASTDMATAKVKPPLNDLLEAGVPGDHQTGGHQADDDDDRVEDDADGEVEHERQPLQASHEREAAAVDLEQQDGRGDEQRACDPRRHAAQRLLAAARAVEPR